MHINTFALKSNTCFTFTNTCTFKEIYTECIFDVYNIVLNLIRDCLLINTNISSIQSFGVKLYIVNEFSF